MDTWLDCSLREDGEDRRYILTWKIRQHGSGRTWGIGGKDFVGGSEQIEKRAEIEKKGKTRDETWSLKDERGERLENKSWRAPRDLADTRLPGRVIDPWRKSKKGKRNSREDCLRGDSTSSTPLTSFFRVLFFFSRKQIELTPFCGPPRSCDLWFEIFKVNLGYRSINTEIYFRSHNCIPRLMAFISFCYDRSTFAAFITPPHLFALIYSGLVFQCDVESTIVTEWRTALNI